MGDKTGIEYLNATWSPIKGCSHISEGCDNCWAERQAARFSKPGEFFHGLVEGGGWLGRAKLYEKELYKPLHWKRPRRIGVCFMGDLFHESVPFQWIAKVFAVMAKARQHQFFVLTKRPVRMKEFLKHAGGHVCPSLSLYDYIEDAVKIDYQEDLASWPLLNVLLGVSVENQEMANSRIPILLECEAAHRYLSIEPMLGPVDLTLVEWTGGGGTHLDVLSGRHVKPGVWFGPGKRINLVILGGESGPGARPMHPAWVQGVRDQCQGAGVPFFFKQWGEWKPVEGGFSNPGDLIHYTAVDENPRTMRRVGKHAAGNMLDGATHTAMPDFGDKERKSGA